MRVLPLALVLVSLVLAGCESAPPQGQRMILEKTTITDDSGTRVEKPAYLTPEAQKPL